MNLLRLLFLTMLISFVGCAYIETPQEKATNDLIREKTRSIELDNQIKAEQLKQAQLQTTKLEAKSE